MAEIIWKTFGDIDMYIEPFCGSLAVLLASSKNEHRVETVNDADHFIVNFWRAIKNNPEETASWTNNLNTEADLFSRHIWLVNEGKQIISRCEGDPDFYSPKVAGWWVWGICNWIGSGWCDGKGSWTAYDGNIVNMNDKSKCGVNRNLLHLGPGRGVNRQLLHLGNAGMGVNRQRLHLGDAGMGVNRRLLHMGSAGMGVDTGLDAIYAMFAEITERIRYVRICCGDWERICTRGALSRGSRVGIFLDPPYSNEVRSSGLYTHDDGDVTRRVHQWCLDNQDNPKYRIILAGYAEEYDLPGWETHSWVNSASYQRADADMENGNAQNRKKETLWFSPNCIKNKQTSLFSLEKL